MPCTAFLFFARPRRGASPAGGWVRNLYRRKYILDLIVVLAVVWLIFTVFRRRKAVAELSKAAHHDRCTREIISTLRSLSNAKVDRVECKLYIKKVSKYHGKKRGGEITAELVLLDITLISSELSQFLEKKQHDMAEILNKLNTCEGHGDYESAIKLREEIPRMRDRSASTFSTFFSASPCKDLALCFAHNNDYTVSENQSMGHIGYLPNDLGIPYSKYNAPRSPFVLDAVAEAAKSIPNVSLSIDKTIPSQKN